ncbi:hypothetical protein C4S75_05590 [Apibacter sp. wkB309]|nr:hypothetical protein C4S75_05590 [Apibacter sp. wkB309]
MAFFNIYVYAQLPVTDATAATNMMKTIQQGVEGLEKLDQTINLLEKAQNQLTDINNYIQTIDDIKGVYKLQKDALKIAGDLSQKKIGRSQLQNISTSLAKIQQSIVLLNKILTKGFFKMSDYERMNVIKDVRDKAFVNYNKIKKYTY